MFMHIMGSRLNNIWTNPLASDWYNIDFRRVYTSE